MKTSNWKSIFVLCLMGFLCTTIMGTPQLQAQVPVDPVRAICVPWQPSNPSIEHYTYSGAVTTLKGIARNGGTEFRWDFGDGSFTSWTAITDPYNLGVKHTYTGSVGRLYVATLYVRDDSANEAHDEYPVKVYKSSNLSYRDELDVRINIAIDEALWYLHTTMIRDIYAGGSPGYGQPYGYWDPGYYPLGAVGTGVDAFQLHGSKVNTDYDSDPYVETVQRGLNYLLANTYSYNIDVQSAGNPDTNGNGIGLVTNQSSSLYDSRQTYLGGICMTVLASSGAPNRIAAVGGEYVYGRTYADIVQDIVDFFAWGQCDSGSFRGGWRYYANSGDSDMSTAQWPPLGMLAAEQNMGSVVPQFVRDELTIFLDYCQNTEQNNDNGVFFYYPPYYPNITKAAAGIICHEFLGTPLTDPKVESALGFIYRHWNDTGSCWDYTQLHGNSYGMYGLMKACRVPQPDIIEITEYDYNAGQQTTNKFDWYYTPAGQAQEGLATYCVNTQQADGSWDDTVGCNMLYDAFCTGWRTLVLLKGVTIIPPVADICYCDKQEYDLNQDIHLDGSCSYHPDITRTVVKYEWDFNYDGTFDPDAQGVQATIVGGFAEPGIYPVALRVMDDNPESLGGPQSSISVCEKVVAFSGCHNPHAYAGGPYIGWPRVPVTLDASRSWDPDGSIILYEWDLDNDGLYGEDDPDCFGHPNDAFGNTPQLTWTWDTPYEGVIGLRVTDDGCENDMQYQFYDGECLDGEEYYLGYDFDYTTIQIGNHSPVSDPGGPYQGEPDSIIILDARGSYDPDPCDDITYAWDLNNDGAFDDSTAAQPQFSVGMELGKVYNVCLKVTDSFGEYDIACTTVEVAENIMPEPPKQYFLIAQVIGGNGTVVPTGGLYNSGDVVNLLATPAVGYAVKAWTGTNNDTSTSNSNSVTMNGPRNVTVEFFALPVICQLTTAVDSGSGTIAPAPGVHSYNYGEQVTLTAQPDTGWLVQSWVEDGTVHPTEATSYMVSMDTNKTVAVNFAAVPVTLTTAVIAGDGTIIPAPGQHIYGMGITVEATAQPASGWQVKSWTENGVLHTTTDTTYSVMMDGDKALDVEFEPEQYTLTTSVASGSGTINPAPGAYTYDSGTVVTVTAAPGQYSQVQSWVENGSVYTATDTSYVVTMDSDKAVAVKFQQQPVELSYDIVAGNGVIPQTSGLYSMGMMVPLSVTPAEGYCVRAWHGTNDDSSTATTNEVFMDSDKAVTVELAAEVETEKCRITLGRSSNVGTIQVSGKFTATKGELASAQAMIYIRIWSPSGFDFSADPIDFDSADIKNGRYNYGQSILRNDPAGISSFKFDLNKGTFSLQIKNLNMAGMINPVYVDIQMGNYVGMAQVCEGSIDGGSVPVSLSQGQADQLRSRKACVTKGKQEHSDTLVLQGDIALAQPDVDLTDVDVNITWCDQVFTIPAGSFKVIKGAKYGCTNADISPSGTATATIDLAAGTYSITLKKVSITQCQCCTATLGISFAEFNETVELHSRQAN